jgi:hypothetical protein
VIPAIALLGPLAQNHQEQFALVTVIFPFSESADEAATYNFWTTKAGLLNGKGT